MVVDKNYEGDSKTARGVKYAMANGTFIKSPANRLFTIINNANGNPVALPIGGTAFNSWLKHAAYRHGDILKNDDLNEINSILSAYAEFEGEEKIIYQRIGRTSEGEIEIDVADKANTRILLGPRKVEMITSGSTTLFGRSNSTLPLTLPSESGDYTVLLPFLNMDDSDKLLLIGYITYLYAHPREKGVGFPVLVIKGEQGAGKSFLCDGILRALIDPNANGIQTFPSEPKEMAIACLNRFLLVYDNIRSLTLRWSDTCCIIVYGGAVTSRALYSDDDEAALILHAPLVLNGIHSFIKEPDLANRCLTIHLLPMDPDNRKLANELLANLELQLPDIFRGLLELTAEALSKLDEAEVLHPQRMMGFVKWLAALEIVMELPAGQLQKAYSENQQQTMLETIQEDHLAYAVLQLAKRHAETPWSGTPAQLLEKLTGMVSTSVARSTKTWPANAIALSKRLSALQKALSAQGVELLLGERGKHRKIVVGMQSDD